MKTSATNRKLRLLLTGIRNETLIPNPDFQRRLVWSNKHKVEFLKTVLDGLPFPEIFIASGSVNTETGEGTELIVDGQQRVTTLYQYFANSPDLKTSTIPSYPELLQEEKEKFLEYEVVVRDLGPLTESETRDLFYRINSTSYSLNAMEVNNARYDGALKRFCDDISQSAFFEDNDVFTALDIRRMNDVRWTLTLVITLLSNYFNRDTEHEEYLRRYNETFEQDVDLRKRLESCFDAVNSMGFPARCRVWQKSDLLTLLVETDIRLDGGPVDLSKAASSLREFYSEVDRAANGEASSEAAEDYYLTTRSGTNDRSARVRRGDIIGGLLDAALPKNV